MDDANSLNNHAGLIIIIVGAVLLAALILVVCLIVEMRKKIAVQRLKFVGRYTADPNTRKMVAHITIANRSLSDVAVTELGLKNGKVNFNYTDVYKAQYKLGKDARIVVGQRDAIRFTLSAEELVKTLIQSKKGKIILKKICVYAMDSTGTPYVGKVKDVKKLLMELAKNGVDYLPPAFEPGAAPASATPSAQSMPAKAAVPMPIPAVAPMPAVAPEPVATPTPMPEPAPMPKAEPVPMPEPMPVPEPKELEPKD